MSARRWVLAILPGALFYVIFFVLPQVAFLRVSLYEPAGPAQLGDGPTLDVYRTLLEDSFYRNAIIQTLWLSTIVSVVGVLVAYPIAYTIARSPGWAGSALFLLVVASMFMSAIVRALGWRVFLGDSGPFNRVLLDLHIVSAPIQLYGNFLGAVIGMVHVMIPFMVLGLLPVCEAVSGNLIHAAYGLGASKWHAFWSITAPLTRRGVVASALVVFAVTAGAFTTVTLLAGGRVAVMSILIRQQTLQLFNYPVGAALSVLLLVIVFTVVATGAILGSSGSVRSGAFKA